MSTTIRSTPPASPYPALRSFSVDEYHRMIAIGILTERDEVELIRGHITFKNPPYKNGQMGPMHESVRPFSVKEYHELIAAGILIEEEKLELINGYVVLKMPGNPPHDSAINSLTELLPRLLPHGWTLRVQLGVTLAESEPVPDIAVASGTSKQYRERHPLGYEVGLVVEVADSSLARHRGEKAELYARSGIPIYWIANIVDRWVEVYTQPATTDEGSRYAHRQDFRPGDAIPLVLAEASYGQIDVRELLG